MGAALNHQHISGARSKSNARPGQPRSPKWLRRAVVAGRPSSRSAGCGVTPVPGNMYFSTRQINLDWVAARVFIVDFECFVRRKVSK